MLTAETHTLAKFCTCADFGWVRQALDGLGAELQRRIEAAGARSVLRLAAGQLCLGMSSCQAKLVKSGCFCAIDGCHQPCLQSETSGTHPMFNAAFESAHLRVSAVPCTPHAGATSRLDKLRLLNHLLFGPGPPPRHRQFAAIPPPDGYGLQIVVRMGTPVVRVWGYLQYCVPSPCSQFAARERMYALPASLSHPTPFRPCICRATGSGTTSRATACWTACSSIGRWAGDRPGLKTRMRFVAALSRHAFQSSPDLAGPSCLLQFRPASSLCTAPAHRTLRMPSFICTGHPHQHGCAACSGE